ncbi:Undecaprenyl-phosphate mannosyltransferase [Andreprevotia sp. IGB-42]|uniref:glycosyltransferase family 2 protein n=1 Tax=Andreprevotia sp. IGB-42 TaxID=2497473 RepID=UPI001358F73F|nr:glycosyltransferase family 2 protein [Andreprevotia sp. IGB-42]KAF0813783.1 Undecaprenyl-phosphate mannosyltransferase [Andreprevotia sp. IGB-42]
MNCIAVIPVYNHEHAIGGVVSALLAHGLPVLLVDDGSSPACAAVLDQQAIRHGVTLARHAVNQGKGAAVVTGLKLAAQQGYSHALQIDADGQHDTADVPRFLAAAQQYPLAVIAGCPVYDDTVPKGRLYGRYATHIWVWINTLSLRITDSMCGYRIYPLASTLPVLEQMKLARRMDFDPEIAVRLDWQGLRTINLPTRVHYPQDGVSHFDYLRDNVRISAMHTRLFFGMLIRLPRLLARHRAPRA